MRASSDPVPAYSYVYHAQIDAEVRDRMLGMIEDYGRYITYPPTFKEVYEGMVDQVSL